MTTFLAPAFKCSLVQEHAGRFNNKVYAIFAPRDFSRALAAHQGSKSIAFLQRVGLDRFAIDNKFAIFGFN